MLEYYTTFINYDTRTLYFVHPSIRPPTSVVIVTYLPAKCHYGFYEKYYLTIYFGI